MMANLKTANVLAFERVLDISDAFLWQQDSQNPTHSPVMVCIQEKSVRGTISNRLKNATANDPTKLDAEIGKPNLQRVDASYLDEDKDTLIAKFTCKVLPFTGKPNVCNHKDGYQANQDYQAALMKVVESYKQQQGMSEVAKRYATNIANARWLWRNRVGAENIRVVVKNGTEEICFSHALEIGLKDFTYNDSKLNQLSAWIEAGLNGEKFTLLEVIAYAKIGNGQEVYPSQELVLDTGSKKSKILYRVGHANENHAGMHSQKISNAIRTIDTWYADYIEQGFPIAIEPYGAVTTLGTAFRQPKHKQDFYSLFDDWVLKGKAPEIEQQHYVMAVLIRGGVFGESGKE